MSSKSRRQPNPMEDEDDFLPTPSPSSDDENVSDVDPDELQKMLEGLDFSDNEENGAKKKKPASTSSSKAQSNLKSSIKTGGNGDNLRKVQFSKDTKPAGDPLLDLLGEGESPGTATAKKPLPSVNTAVTATAKTTTENVGQLPKNKSKVMQELFGTEESSSKNSSTNVGPNSATSMASRKSKIENDDDDDDLFAGLGGNDSRPRKASASDKADFMSSLFGGASKSSSSQQKSKEFVLDDKYKRAEVTTAAAASISSEANKQPPARSRRGTPYIQSTSATATAIIPNPSSPETSSTLNPLSLETADPLSLQPQQPRRPPPASEPWLSAPPQPQPPDNAVVNDGLRKQIQQLEDFEKEQQARFLREIEDHRRHLEAQQSEHRSILDQQRSLAREQLKVFQERQSSALRHQQAQCEVLMKQLQTQMEAEMRLKTELVRNQMAILAEVQTEDGGGQTTSDLSDFMIRNQSGKDSRATVTSEREARLKAAHAEEIEELQQRIQHWVQRTQQLAEEHQKELEAERERRKRDLHEQSEDHKITVETIRADYAILVEKIKELKNMEFEASIEAKDSSKAIDALLHQMTSNMDEVAGLRQGLEDRLSKHVDVREALLKKKDEQLQALQTQLIAKSQENQEEQKLLRETIGKLEEQLRLKEAEFQTREVNLKRQENALDEHRRKFDTEKEITLASLREDEMRLRDEKTALEEERRQLHKAVEKEHNFIVAEKARLKIEKRLGPHNNALSRDIQASNYPNANINLHEREMEAMIKAIEVEKQRVAKEWDAVSEAKSQMTSKKQRLREDQRLIEETLRKLAIVDSRLDKKLSKFDSLVEAVGRTRTECKSMIDECQAIEAARGKAIAEAKSEAVERLEAVEREAQRLEAIREAANKERRRLLHTRTAILCTRCQKPLMIEAGGERELSNLGLRTAGDGETLSSSLHQLASLRKDAQRDQDYLAREAYYLQHLATL